MKIFIAAILVVSARLAASEKICFPPQAEYRILTAISLDDLYMAADYDKGKVIVTPANDTHGDLWSLFDLNESKTYFKGVDGRCFYKECPTTQLLGQCLPEDSQFLRTIDNHDLYSVTTPSAVCWVMGVTKIEGSDQYHRHLSRLSLRGAVLDVGISYECATTIADPTVFDKDTSACVEVKIPHF